MPEELPDTTAVEVASAADLHQRMGAGMVLGLPGEAPAAVASAQFTRFASLQYSCGLMLK